MIVSCSTSWDEGAWAWSIAPENLAWRGSWRFKILRDPLAASAA